MAGPTNIGQQVVWGTDSSTTYGLIQSMTTGKGGEMKEYKNYQGDTVSLVIYDEHDTIQLTALCTGSTPTLPAKGAEFTVGRTTYRCTDASVNWSNEDAASVSISGRTYPNLGGSSSGTQTQT
ncbi:MAG: hypothetical protein IJQ00_00830 [Kiritimatiellae bacterium]|nr:hypothetical protein [Kiritimatiellia bacterium]